MITYEIKDNPYTGGLYAFFEHEGCEFYADLSDIPGSDIVGYKNECMIFPAKDGKVTSWSELYCKRNIPVTIDSLAACIVEFVAKDITGRLLSDGWKATRDKDGKLVLVRFSDPRVGYKPDDGTLIIGFHEYPDYVYDYEQLMKIIDNGEK